MSRWVSNLSITPLFVVCLTTVASQDLDWCGNKHKNLVILDSIFKDMPNVSVPPFFGITSERIEAFLFKYMPDLVNEYQVAINLLRDNQIPRDDYDDLTFHPTAEEILAKIQSSIRICFGQHNLDFTPQERAFIKRMEQQQRYCMVRSTGIEDSQTVANAGGNVSIAYVQPTIRAMQDAMAEVVASYFGMQSLKNRMAGSELTAELCLPVLIQELIGEKIGGAAKRDDIPVSGVMFSMRQSYSAPNFAVTEINAAFGHGEGVVANKVMSDCYYVTPSRTQTEPMIYHVVRHKPLRLVAQYDARQNKYNLMSHKNSQELAYCSALSDDQIRLLCTVGKKIEQHYGQPMDIEYVFLGDYLYIVQARPAMKSEQLPAYLAINEMPAQTKNAIKAEITTIKLVPGKDDLLEIINRNDVVIAHDLDTAEQDPHSNTCKVVFVNTWASSLSHAAVNFMAKGIPCLYVADISVITNMCNNLSAIAVMLISPQQGICMLWDTTCTNYGDYRRNGWFEHPIQAALSLGVAQHTKVAAATSPLPQDTGLKKLFALCKAALPEQRQELINQISQRMQARLDLTHRRLINIWQNKAHDKLQEVFGQVVKTVNYLVSEMRSAVENNADTLEILFYLKMLETIAFQPSGSSVLSAYTHSHCLDELFAMQPAHVFKRKHGQGAVFAQEILLSQYCPTRELADQWVAFLQQLEKIYQVNQKIFDAQTITQFKDMLQYLKTNNCLSLWFVTEFYQCYQAKPHMMTRIFNRIPLLGHGYKKDVLHINICLKKLISGFKSHRASLERLMSYRNAIAAHADALYQFNDATSARNAWLNVEEDVIKPMTTDFVRLYKSLPQFTQFIAVDIMYQCVDFIDTATKTVKMGAGFIFAERLEQVKTMVNSFYTIFDTWAKTIMPAHRIKYHWSYPLDRYMQAMVTYKTNIFEQEGDESVFQRSKDFAVNAAMLGSATAIERHEPKTVEDFFMLMHQNSLVCISALSLGNQLDEVMMIPAPIKNIMNLVENKQTYQQLLSRGVSRPQRIGARCSEQGIEIMYNMSLSNHSSTFQIVYDRNTQDCYFNLQFLGQARSRWQTIEAFAQMSPELSKLELAEVKCDTDAGIVAISWRITSPANLETIIDYLIIMGGLSFERTLNINDFRQVLAPEFVRNQNQHIKTVIQNYLKQKAVDWLRTDLENVINQL